MYNLALLSVVQYERTYSNNFVFHKSIYHSTVSAGLVYYNILLLHNGE